MAASILTIELSPETYDRLRAHADARGKSPEELSRELIERALHHDADSPRGNADSSPTRTVREILAATGRLRDLGPTLEAKIIPGVTLREVQDALTHAEGPSLSEIVDSNRGPKD